MDEINIYRALPDIKNIRSEVVISEGSVSVRDELSTLIADCIGQSRAAQKKLYDLYAPAAYGVIKRYLYNKDSAADEILNDAFYKIFTKLEQYSFQGAFEGWIRRIVINTITDHLRKNLKNEHLTKEIQTEDAYVNSEPIESISYKELLKLVQTLPESQRLVFNLFVFEDYSHRDIGNILGMSENNSRWYLNDARKRLKDKVNNMIMANKK